MAAGGTGRGYLKETATRLQLDNSFTLPLNLELATVANVRRRLLCFIYHRTLVLVIYYRYESAISAGVCINVIYRAWLLTFAAQSSSGQLQLTRFTLETGEDIRSVMYRQSMTNTSACLIKCPHAPFQIRARRACPRAGGDSIGWEELMPCVWLIKTALDISVRRDGGEVLIHN